MAHTKSVGEHRVESRGIFSSAAFQSELPFGARDRAKEAGGRINRCIAAVVDHLTPKEVAHILDRPGSEISQRVHGLEGRLPYAWWVPSLVGAAPDFRETPKSPTLAEACIALAPLEMRPMLPLTDREYRERMEQACREDKDLGFLLKKKAGLV